MTTTPITKADLRNPEARAQLVERFQFNVPYLLTALNERDRGASWRREPRREDETDRDLVRLVNGAGEHPEGMSLRLDTYDGTITAYGKYGPRVDGGGQWTVRDYVRGGEDPRPTMSANKTPVQLAADLVRRLLPAYRELRAIYLAYRVRETEARQAVRDLALELAILGGERLAPRRVDPHADLAVLDVVPAADGVHGDVTVYSGESVRVELSLDAQAARQLVAWMGTELLRRA